MRPVTITEVRPSRATPGLWIITDSVQTKYATEDQLKALLADRYRLSGQKVWIDSASGFYYRDLREIKPAKDLPRRPVLSGVPPVRTAPADEPVCPKYGSRCRWRYATATTLQCARNTCLAIKRADNGLGYR
jgi:hypothetical protein